MKRKILALAVVFALSLSIAACGGSSSAPASSSAKSEPAAAASSAPAAAAETSAASSAASESAAAFAASSASAESSAPATEIKADALVLRIGTGTGGKDKQVAWMEEFEKELEAATDGAIDVECYPAGQLGTMAELVQGTVDGSVDAACYPTNYFSTIFPGAAVIDLPNLFPYGGVQLQNILMTQDTLYEEEFENHGVIPISWLLVPDRTIISSSKIESMDDLKNKIIWSTPSSVLIKEIEMLGAVSSTINVGELAPSLQNGTVEGAATDITLYVSQSLQNSGGNFLLEAPGDAMVSIFGVSKAWWDRCPDDLKPVVQQVANDTVTNFEIGYVKDQVAGAYKVMQADGMEVVEPSEEFRAAIDEALSGMPDWFLSTYPEAQAVYDDMLERIAADTATYERF